MASIRETKPPVPRLFLSFLLLLFALASSWSHAAPPPPERLADTGWSRDGRNLVAVAPQYPLWSDSADKRRWLTLPPGSAIDASKPDAWVFPRGTKLWKEFALGGRPIETRLIERLADGSWRFATYVWDAAGTDARLAPARGIPALPRAAAPDGRYAIPSRSDCLACHGSAAVPVLGVSALQLSPDRDPLAAGTKALRGDEVDLRGLVERGLVRGLPRELLQAPPRIVAATPVERAALGTLHGNCAHCHNRSANRAPLALSFEQSARDPTRSRATVLASTVDAMSRWQPSSPNVGNGEARVAIVDPGRSNASALVMRMASRNPATQMPPLGTALPDREGLTLVRQWIDHELVKENRP